MSNSIFFQLSRNKLALVGLFLISFIAITALLAPILPLQDPLITNLAERIQVPFSPGHFLGTDELGRDILSRLIWGARVSLAVGLIATCIAAVVGSWIGLCAGYYGRWIDGSLMRGIDILMAFPYMMLILAIISALGPGLMNAMYAISIITVPFYARAVRGATLTICRLEYIDAAKLSGKSDLQIILTEILPNVVPIIVVTVSTTIGWMILQTAGLSFLGLGAQPPTADLGSMLGEGRKLLLFSPHVATVPGVLILFIVIGINLLGDGIRDLLDPRLKSGNLSSPTARTEVQLPPNQSPPAKSSVLPNALQVSNLRTSFFNQKKEVRAVDDVSFTLEPGVCLGVIGESGCGKSVTAMSILGLVPSPPGKITGGSIHFENKDLITLPLALLQRIRGRRIAYIFQDPLHTLNPLLPVGEQIAECIRYHQGLSRKAAMQRALDLIEAVKIPNARARLKSYPHELSGGMRQRICIAMALANDPDIIVADEPTTALDVTIQSQILDLLDSLRRERNISILFISHDVGVISELCDSVIVMYAGQIVEAGKVQEVLENPQHRYTQKLIDCVPAFGQPEKEMEPIRGMPPLLDQLPTGCYFADRCDHKVEACTQQMIPLKSLSPHRQVRCIQGVER